MTSIAARPIGRRRFLVDLGRGTLGIAVLGLAACSSEDATPRAARSSGAGTAASTTPPDADASTDPPTDPSSDPEDGGAQGDWTRVDLGFVSAYVLVRGQEAAVVDTGVGGSADEIGATLRDAGTGWAGLRHVVLTHKHPDHAGSIAEVMTRAPRATAYAGAADLRDIDAPRTLESLDDGDELFGLQIVASPGHTRGHVAVFDPASGVLVAGDALTNTSGLAGSNPQFTEDADAAVTSVRRLARLRPSTILVGHGAPVDADAATALDRLAASLR